MNADVSFEGRIRNLRQRCRLTMGQLSARAGVSKASLSRWEAGTCRPRSPELQRVLDALDAPPAEQSEVLALLDAPRALLALKNQEDAVMMRVSLGDLLYGLRQRAGKTQADIARAAGVSRSLVSQWENDAGLPTGEQLHAVGYALGATATEVGMLTTRAFAQIPLEKSREALLNRYRDTMYWSADVTEMSYKLHLLSLLGGFTRLLRAGRADTGDLALIFSSFGVCAQVWDNDPEQQRFYHRRALTLAAASCEPTHFHIVSSVRSLLDPALNLLPLRERVGAALEWQPRFRSRAGQAYLLSFIANALAEAAPDEALRIGDQYCALVADDPDELPCRLHDRGVLLRKCGRYGASVAYFAALREPDAYREGLKRLEIARGLGALGASGEAQRSIADAKQLLSNIDSPFLSAEIRSVERAVA